MPGTSGVYTDPAATRNVASRAPAGVEAHGFGELCGVPRGLCGRTLFSLSVFVSLSLERTHAKNVGTSVVYIGERRKRARRRSSTDGNERKRKGRESAYAGCDRVEDTEDDGAATMRTVEEDGTFACLRRFRAVSDNKRRSGRCDGKSFGRAFCESALNEKVEYLFSCSRTRRNISGIYFLRCLVLYNAGAALRADGEAAGAIRRKTCARNRGVCLMRIRSPFANFGREFRNSSVVPCRIDRSIDQ